ncbi:MAG: VOC family protein [Coriobacteriia bacterium]|nr:VOC family protein [Coriobacteriia bacterium]MBS5477316.1 VOC family protein [Coriobacteriia bacterium]
MQEDPRELFDMRLAHVGINAQDAADAARIADEFHTLLHLSTSTTPVSHFADTMVEIMDGNGRGEHGHIGFHVNDLIAAATWFDAHDYEIDQQSWARYPDGTPRLVYFARSIAGFAIHLTQD